MSLLSNTLRYCLPKKAIKSDCPDCGFKHRKTLSRYVDTQTGESLPQIYGRCDRESNCGYHLSPYQKGPSGLSYWDEVKADSGIGPIPKSWFRMAGKLKRNGSSRQGFIQTLTLMEGATTDQAERIAAHVFDQKTFPRPEPQQAQPVYTIQEEMFQQSLGHYQRNQFARLLWNHFGLSVGYRLLQQFQIGTSARWPGACVFWYIDEKSRIRGGQIKLFDETFHTVKYVDQEGQTRSKTSWVHSALIRKYNQQQTSPPQWLSDYDQYAERSPCLFGLPQLLNAPTDQPIAIVEAPKTAVICTPYFPGFIWLAVGALGYLNTERMAPLRGRSITLFPDTSKDGSALRLWSQKREDLQKLGYNVSISEDLEELTTTEQKEKGFDLADLILEEWAGYPPDWNLSPGETSEYNLVPSPNGTYYAQRWPITPDQAFTFTLNQINKK